MDELIAKLKEEGVIFEVGLSVDKLDAIENKISGILPLDLKEFLRLGVPVDYPKYSEMVFPNWHNSIDQILRNTQHMIDQFFESDIDDGYWRAAFGDKPTDPTVAKKKAREFIYNLPNLIPIYGHRFMIAVPMNSPIISFHGPLDSVIYADNIKSYFSKEFELDLDPESYSRPELARWGEVLDL